MRQSPPASTFPVGQAAPKVRLQTSKGLSRRRSRRSVRASALPPAGSAAISLGQAVS